MKQLRNGAGWHMPQHYSGTQSSSGRVLSHARSLTAAVLAVAMMASVAVTTLLPTYSAEANPSAGICTPQSISLGDDVSASTVDSGVATYVGGNMYVGANNQNSGSAYTDLSSTQKIDRSYAVEAEGLTLVNGKLATNGAKTSWSSKGFRFGVVGFGAQFRPQSGSDVLVVAGSGTSNAGQSTGTMTDAANQSVSALGGFDNGSTGRAFVQNEGTGNNATWYSARINGNTSWHLNAVTNVSSGSNAGRSVWDATASVNATDTNVHYDNTVGLSNISLNGDQKDYSTFYADNVLGLSTQLAGLQSSEGVYVADATVSTAEASGQASTTGATYSNGYYTRHHYNYDGTKNTIQYGFKFDVSGSNAEKLITFTGDKDSTGKGSAMQVFNVTAEQLSSSGSRGVDFMFTNIPDDASVVVNVSGNVDFHTGWRFWWNGLEIGDGYSKAATPDQKTAYSTAAQKIMWNFTNATQVTIRGGVANEGARDNKQTDDDPAAAMLGSILVPNGNFEDHVTTNGRVYVGGDFSMYNPTVAANVAGANSNGWEGATASVINMDQERHNLPWNGTFNSSCAVIQINKVTPSKKALAGTTWGVFENYADAKNGTAAKALRIVKDGGAFDLDNTDNGTIQIGSLNPNATYYLKEIASTDGFKVSDKVYAITAGGSGTIAQTMQESSDGETWTNVEGNQIVNQPSGANLEWSKVDGGDASKELAGSEWQLQMQNSTVVYRITDSTKNVAWVKLYYNGELKSEADIISMTDAIPFDLTSSVFAKDGNTSGVPQDVQWSATGSVVVNRGTVTAVNEGEGIVKACSLASTSTCASIKVNVPEGTVIPSAPKTTTIFYPISSTFSAGNTTLHYTFGDNTWSDLAFAAADGCANAWQKVTIDNTRTTSTELQFVVKGAGNNWDNNSNANYKLGLADGAVFYKSDSAFKKGVPPSSGCTVDTGGTTSNKSITINNESGKNVIGLRDDTKALQLTATTKPAGETVTWHSGNSSIATVDGTGKVTGVKAGGPITITARSASGAQDSISITVKDDSLINVYFKKSTVSWWGAYYLHYQQAAGTDWAVIKMEDAPGCGDYVMASIPRSNVIGGHGYYFRDGENPKSANWYNQKGVKGAGNSPFTFESGKYSDMYVDTNGNKGTGKPSGCSATAESSAKMGTRVSTAVLRTKASVTAIDDENSAGDSTQSSVANTVTIAECGDAAGKCDTNTKAGEFRVVDLADGTYTLTETVAPNGFGLTNRVDENGNILNGQVYDIVIENGQVSSIKDHYTQQEITGNKIPNSRETGAISWNKISSDSANDSKLGGSEWTLTKTKSFSWVNGKATYADIAEGQQSSITITDCTPGKGTTCSAPTEGQTIYDVDPVEGQFKLEGLEWGTYTLVESKAPDGYDVDFTVRTFTFGPAAGTDGTGTWNSNSVESKTGDTTGGFTTSSADYSSSVFTFTAGDIKNKPGVILPGTGGAGDYWIYAAALVAALIGVVAAGMALKVRRRQ